MPQLHLSLGPGQSAGALEGAAVVVLVHQVEQRLARGGHQRPEGQPCHLARGDAHAVAHREDWVQHRAGQRGAVSHGLRRGRRASAAQETFSVGFVLHRRRGDAFDDREMRRPHRRLVGRARAARGDHGAELGQVFGLHEHLGEGRMGIIGRGRRQHHLGVGGEFDLARLAAGVGDCDAADLAVGFGRHHHLHRGRQAAVVPREGGVILGEDHFMAVGRHAQGLCRGGPDPAAVRVSQVDVGAPVVAGRVFAPAGHGQVAPAAVARARRGQHDGVAPVGQQVRGGCGHGRHAYAPHRVQVAMRLGRAGWHFLGARVRHGDEARHALLQQQFAGLDHRLTMEAFSHARALQRVGDGDQRHALVVRHEVAHDGDL